MFESIDSNKKYQQVISQLEELILNKKLKKGDKLPPEKELMETLNVSRSSIREAISALSSMGLVTRKAKEGTTIDCDIELGLCKPLALTYKLDGGDMFDVLSFRYILEIQVVKIIIVKCSDEELKSLELILEESKKASSNKELLDLDIEFHKALSKLADNKLISYFNEAIRYLMQEQMNLGYNKFYNNSNKPFEYLKETLIENHTDIVNGLKTRNLSKALQSLVEGFETANPEYDFKYERLCI